MAKLKLRKLTPEEERVILGRGTEEPFSGKYESNVRRGVYVCKRCGAKLYDSRDKFDAHCGWPSFDQEIEGAVKRVPDPDGVRTEIECARCGAHLGHVFAGEHYTQKNVRHCVNSISLLFVPKNDNASTKSSQTIVFGGGCFWCTEAVFKMIRGVINTEPGYAGGMKKNPTYREVCTGKTGHAEVLKVAYDPRVVTLEKLLDIFFEMHDPTSANGQGADRGSQYRSVIFYTNSAQKATIVKALAKMQETLTKKIVTEVRKLGTFYPAEAGHRNYYDRNRLQPYCLFVVRPKISKIRREFAESLK